MQVYDQYKLNPDKRTHSVAKFLASQNGKLGFRVHGNGFRCKQFIYYSMKSIKKKKISKIYEYHNGVEVLHKVGQDKNCCNCCSVKV